MKEHGILFNAEMVRAILDGRKTQTRRMVKMPEGRARIIWDKTCHEWFAVSTPEGHLGVDMSRFHIEPPLGFHGDRLWVREAFRIYDSATECACYDECKCASMNGKPLYRASDPSPGEDKWTPSIHMPRWASRITLEITAVRVERLQEITEEDAKAEGVESVMFGESQFWKAYGSNPLSGGGELAATRDAKRSFQTLWSSIYGGGSWDANPWVFVYEFRRIQCP